MGGSENKGGSSSSSKGKAKEEYDPVQAADQQLASKPRQKEKEAAEAQATERRNREANDNEASYNALVDGRRQHIADKPQKLKQALIIERNNDRIAKQASADAESAGGFDHRLGG